MTVTELKVLAQHYEEDLRNFRLSGNIEDIYSFIIAAIQEHSGEEINEQGFLDALTAHEHTAYKAIFDEIGEAGNISVVKMIQKTGLSRPVFTSLLQKMEKYNIALVKNQGVKGTNITFLGFY